MSPWYTSTIERLHLDPRLEHPVVADLDDRERPCVGVERLAEAAELLQRERPLHVQVGEVGRCVETVDRVGERQRFRRLPTIREDGDERTRDLGPSRRVADLVGDVDGLAQVVLGAVEVVQLPLGEAHRPQCDESGLLATRPGER